MKQEVSERHMTWTLRTCEDEFSKPEQNTRLYTETRYRSVCPQVCDYLQLTSVHKVSLRTFCRLLDLTKTRTKDTIS